MNKNIFDTKKELFVITDSALIQLKKSLIKNTVFYLTIKKMGCTGYAYDLQQQKTENIDDSYLKVNDNIDFYIDKNYIHLLNNILMKWDEDSIFKKSFIFENPNAKNSCGCGESFTNE